MAEIDIRKLPIDASYTLNEYYCRISIRGVEFYPQNIVVLRVKEWIFDIVPRIELDFYDDSGRFSDKFPIVEGDQIKLELSKHPSLVNQVEATFRVLDYVMEQETRIGSATYLISLTGYLYSDNLFITPNAKVYKNKKTSEVTKLIASELGFKPDIRIESNDNQNWYKFSSNKEFLEEICYKGYVQNNDATFVYIDRKGNLVYTTLNTELNKEQVKTATYNAYEASRTPKEPDQENIIYSAMQIYNIGGSLNTDIGYGVDYNYFNLDANVTKEIRKQSDFKIPNKSSVNKNDVADSYIFGKSALNTHANYYQAMVQNDYVKKNYFNFGVILTVNAVYDINLFDVINLNVISKDDSGDLNTMMSGKYVVGAVMHEASKAEYAKLIVTLFRNGMNDSGVIDG